MRAIVRASEWRACPADLSAEALDAWRALMLAQAQRCFFKRASRDQKQSALVAKLAVQVSKYYDEAVRKMRSLKHVEHRGWLGTAEMLAKLYEAWAHHHAAASHEAAFEYSAQVARLDRALALDRSSRVAIIVCEGDHARAV